MSGTISFDHTSLNNQKELFEWGEYFRGRPVEYSEAHGGFWVVSRHEDLVHVLKNPDVFASGSGTTLPSIGLPVPALPTQSDEPKHRFYRTLLAPFLTPGSVARKESAIRQIISNAIDTFIERGEADLVTELAQPIPAQVMARTFGFNEDEASFVSETFAAIMKARTLGDSEGQRVAVDQYMAWVRAQLSSRRSRPREDLASTIVAAQIEGSPLGDEECEGILWTAAAGAIETTAHAIGHSLHLLAEFPDIRARLLAEPSLIQAAVE
jgi:cytochrome P450